MDQSTPRPLVALLRNPTPFKGRTPHLRCTCCVISGKHWKIGVGTFLDGERDLRLLIVRHHFFAEIGSDNSEC